MLVGKNLFMDFLLFGILAFYFVRGCFKGFVGMLFSLLGTFVAVCVAYFVCGSLGASVEKFLGASINASLTQILNGAVPGTFTELSALQAAVSQSKYAMIFNLILSRVIGNLTINGQMSAGQILAPTLTNLIVKVLTFAVVFVCVFILLKIVAKIINKLLKRLGMGFGNRILGGVLGAVKGLVLFGILFFVLSSAANLFLSAPLLKFVQSGAVSNWLYSNVIKLMFNLIY